MEAARRVWEKESTRQYLADLQLDQQGVQALVLAAQLACLPSAPAPDKRAAPRRPGGKRLKGPAQTKRK